MALNVAAGLLAPLPGSEGSPDAPLDVEGGAPILLPVSSPDGVPSPHEVHGGVPVPSVLIANESRKVWARSDPKANQCSSRAPSASDET